jgi:ABC-type maltose transport system permease subunit
VAAVLGISLVFVLFPIYYVIVAAFDATNSLGSLWPTAVTTQNFHTLLNDPTFPFLTWLWNSVRVSAIVAVGSVLITAMAAYSFSRFRFKGRQPLMKSIVLVQLFPNLLALIAIYIMVQQIGRSVPALGLNSPWSLILVYLGGVLGGSVWLMKGYLDSLPRELDESAMIDGAGHVTIFLRILLPLARPMLAVIAVLSFVGTYGEVLLARVLLTDVGKLTLAVGMWSYVSGQYNERWGPFAAGALLASIPVLIFFYLLQDWLVSGLTQGSVKS